MCETVIAVFLADWDLGQLVSASLFHRTAYCDIVAVRYSRFGDRAFRVLSIVEAVGRFLTQVEQLLLSGTNYEQYYS